MEQNSGVGVNLFESCFGDSKDCDEGKGIMTHQRASRLQQPLVYYEADTLPDFPLWNINNSSPHRFFLMTDIRREISWECFRHKYVSYLDAYNIHVSCGRLNQREAIHCYHFPPIGQREASAPTPNCVEGMPTNSDGFIMWYLSKPSLSVLFERLVGVTGFNAAMVLVPKAPLSLFNAFACSHYAAVRKGVAKTDRLLLKACINWLLKDNCKSAQATTVTKSILVQGSAESNTIKRILDVWCDIMLVPLWTHDVEKICRMHKHLSEIVFTFDAVYSTHFPLLNELFVMVLCVMCKSAITVLDNKFGKVYTFTPGGCLFPTHHLIVLKVKENEYFGVLDLDACVFDS